MKRKFLLWGLGFGIVAILLGAFGAHGLKSILNEAQLDSFETGVRYQLYHAFFLLFIGTQKNLQSKVVLNLTVIGVFLFSFSIYMLNFREYLTMDFLKFLGPVTPIGGLLLIAAWSLLFVKVFKQKS